MAATTGYQAGVETNGTQMSYAVETAYGTAPATTFNALRITAESLSSQKQRQRPSEINATREASTAVTTQQSASGGINYAFSYGTFDDLIASCLNNDWQAAQALAGVSGDITITNVSATSATLSSTTSGKFNNLNAGQWIRLLGFTNANNNGFFRVMVKTSGTSLTLATLAATVTETPAGAAAQVRAQSITNGTSFKSLFMQQKLSANLWLRYPGAYVSSWALSAGIGQFLNGTFNILAQQETNQTADASTGGINAAPSGRVMDPIAGVGGILLNEAPISATLDSFSLTVNNTGAALEFGIGSAAAAGIMAGTAETSGTVKMYFKDFTLYTRAQQELTGTLEFIVKDSAQNAYVITLLNATLINPQINAGGPGQPVWATFTIEGNPQVGGGTIMVDKLPAT